MSLINPYAATPLDADRKPAAGWRGWWPLGLLFGAMYFVQGIAEPTEGLIAQPVIALLQSWQQTPAQITAFAALLAIPWSLKPLYGLLTDFVPLAGYRRKSYLVLFSALAAVTLGGLSVVALPAGSRGLLLALLLVPTLSVAFCDVVIDALMVERGQQLGITGKLQAIQWGSMYAATLLAGSLGGRLSQHGLAASGFLICSVLLALTLIVAMFAVREPRDRTRRAEWRQGGRELWLAGRGRGMAVIAGFLFLWSFNPFSNAVLQLYATGPLELGRDFYGDMVSLSAAGSIAACASYGLFCRRLSRLALVHAAIVLGMASNLSYLFLSDKTSAVWISVLTGFFYMTATLIQFDLAAQLCPVRVAGTAFALLMALSNLSTLVSTSFGGTWFEGGQTAAAARGAFEALIFTGAAFTAGCWLLVPLLRRAFASALPASATS
ncbi:MAG: MFS transporter [Pirellulales bacterium]